jgi:aspartate kinase
MIVMKFGGTSVGDAAAVRRVIAITGERLGKRPVVVVSALSKVTDTLCRIAELSASGDYAKAEELAGEIYKRHIDMCRELFGENSERMAQCQESVKTLVDDLLVISRGVSILSELSDRSLARIMSYGELLSSNVIAQAFREAGISCSLADARQFIITDSNYLCGDPDFYLIKEKAPAVISKELANSDVVLTQGFIASALNGITSVLGRGGSDYTASLIGMAMDAEEIEIWTDVDGVHTVDPGRVSNTTSIAKLSFEEAAELASFGAKVLHPLTIQPAIEKSIPVKVLNSMNPDNPGTIILKSDQVTETGVKSLSFKENITVVNIFSARMLNTSGFLSRVFGIFSKYNASVDLISTSEVNISLTLGNSAGLENIIVELSKFSKVSIETDKSQVSLIGKDLKSIKGVAGRIFGVLAGYNVSMISQGASDINVSFVVDRRDLNAVLNILHKEFFE